HRNVLLLDFGITKEIRPVIEVVDLNAFAGKHLRGPFWCCGKRENQKLAVVWNLPVHAASRSRKTRLVSLTRTCAEGRMAESVVDLVRVLREPAIKLLEGPDRLTLGIDRLRHLPDE